MLLILKGQFGAIAKAGPTQAVYRKASMRESPQEYLGKLSSPCPLPADLVILTSGSGASVCGHSWVALPRACFSWLKALSQEVEEYGGEEASMMLGSQTWLPPWPITYQLCTWGELFILSVPLFSHLYHEDNNFLGVWSGVQRKRHVKILA